VRFALAIALASVLLISAADSSRPRVRSGVPNEYSGRRIPKDAVRLNDDSDWWSLGRKEGVEPSAEADRPQWLANKAPTSGDVARFFILGVRPPTPGKVENHWLREIEARLGKAKIVERGDGAAGREQLCYKSAADSGNIKLLFEHNEVFYSFILFDTGPGWKGIEYCAESPKVTAVLATRGGLKLGLTEAETESILGIPTYAKGSTRWYEFETHRFVTVSPNAPEDWEISGTLELGFSSHKLTYLAASRSEIF
jgi:hypothetical protein